MLGLNQISLAVNRLLGPSDDAALNLNFLSGTLDSRITFTRASTATRYNASGLLETVASDVPRFDYDPVTLAPKGLLIEESRTNQHTNSRRLSDWLMYQGSATLDASTSPDGLTNAISVLESATFGLHQFYSNSNLQTTSGQTYTFSIYAKANGRTRCQVNCQSIMLSTVPLAFYDLSNGTVDNIDSGAAASISSVGNDWYRLTYTFTANSNAAAGTMYLNLVSTGTTVSYAGNSANGMYFYGAQLEPGSFATSYIPTTTTAVTRAADVAVMTGTNFSSWYNQTEGTFVGEGSFMAVTGDGSGADGRFISVNDGTTDNRFVLYHYNTGMNVFIQNSGTTTNIPIGTVSANVTAKVAFGYKTGDYAACQNSAAVNTATSPNIPAVNRIDIGGEIGGDHLNGYLRSIKYYNTRKSNSDLQTLTS